MNYYKYPQRLLKKLNSESGVTLTILVITIVVLLIIASIVLVNSNAGSEQRALNNMYNDIRALDGKIAVYYEKNKELPVLYDESGKAKVALYFEKYDELKTEYDMSIDKTVIKQQLHDTERNINDNEVYYVIDTSKLDNINLSYAERENEEYTYVINEKSHTIYYLPGVALKDATYYKLPIEYEDIIVNQKYTVKYVVNGSVVQKTGNLNYGDKTPSAPEVTDIEEGYAFVGWMPESDKTIVLKSEDIEEILVEHDETYTAQIKDKNQAITYELFGGENNENNTEGYIIGERKEILNPDRIQKGRNFENEEDTSGIDYTLNEENLEKCDEYIFDGWYLDKDYKIELPKDSEENYYIPEEGIYPNTILYAKWSAPAAKVIYNEMQPVYEFNYTGDVQEFIVPADGTYKIEAWGAAGGYSLNNNKKGIQGGNGGYTSGKVELKRGETLYIYVGNKGEDGTYKKDAEASFNGGGLGTWDHEDDEAAGAGGGATDIRLVSGEWNDFESLKSRVMVAGGGGGTSWDTQGGAAGGLEGYAVNKNTVGGSQTRGYKFGIGQDGYGTGDSDGVAGAGGGYYGGTASDSNYSGVYESAAGGSSFISGHEGCDAIDELSTEDNIIHTSQNIHYSGRKFTDTEMIDGEDSNMPSKDGEGTITGNSGNGYVKIKIVKLKIEEEKYYLTLKEAIADCEKNATNITKLIMLKNVNETNVIENGEKILLNLNEKTITTEKDFITITVKKGELQVIGNGKVENTTNFGKAIQIEKEGKLVLGEKGKPVSKEEPKITGPTDWFASDTEDSSGIKNNGGIFEFYDGIISGPKAILGEITEKEDKCNVATELDENISKAWLDYMGEAAAKIDSIYYPSLETALDAVKEMEYESKEKQVDLSLYNLQRNDIYYFEEDITRGSYVPNNKGISNSTAHSLIPIDLSGISMTETFTLTVNASISSENYDVGYATITQYSDAPNYNDTDGRFMYISGTVEKQDYSTELIGGKIYYLHLGYRKDGSADSGDDIVSINSIKLNGKEISTINYKKVITENAEEVKIVILRNLTIESDVDIIETKNVNIDLNGYTIYCNKVNNYGILHISDSSEEKLGSIYSIQNCVIYNPYGSKLKISSGTVKLNSNGTSYVYKSVIKNEGKIEILGGSIVSEGRYVYGIYADVMSELILGNANITVRWKF